MEKNMIENVNVTERRRGEFQYNEGEERPLNSLKSNFSCKNYNLIYVVIYRGCGAECTSKTGTRLKEKVQFNIFSFFK